MFQCVLADPPWQYADKKADMKACGPGADSYYHTLPLDKIGSFLTDNCLPRTELTLADTIADDAHLWCWVTNGFLADGTGAEVVKRWGFTSKTVVTWVKGRLTVDGELITDDELAEALRVPKGLKRRLIELFAGRAKLVQHIGTGSYLRNSTEHLIFATRGRAPAAVRDLPTSFIAPRGEHSVKPDIVYDWAERLMPDVPRLELFGRRLRAGWVTYGDDPAVAS